MTDGVELRVLVVDDQPIARAGLRMLLEAEADIEVVAEAVDGFEAVSMTSELVPDVVVMDIRMPRLDGIGATRALLALPAAPSVLVVTTFDLDEYVLGALRAGASGFLVKDCDPQELVDGVRAVRRGDIVLATTATRRLVAAATAYAPAAPQPPPLFERLSEREREIFESLARGLSNARIAVDLHLSEHTVKTHIGSVFAKLGLTSRVQAVIAAYEWGVVRPGR